MQVAIKGGDLAAALKRDPASVRAVFDSNRDAVLDTYKQALERDNTLRDGMVVRLHVLPDGSVDGGSVVVSTSINPSLDAEVVKTMGDWKFAPSGTAPVDIDYPLIFATSSSDIGSLEADLNTKFASLGPDETPEYASAPSVAPTPPAAAATPEAAAPAPTPPAVAALPSPEAPAISAPPRPRRHRAPSPAPLPTPSVSDRVNEALAADKRLRRVRAYASGGGLVTLTGKVFDDNAKNLAERTVRNVSGVNGVIDNLTTDTSVWAQNEALINQRLQAEGLTGVTVKVIGDGAYLDGTVKNKLDRDRAATIAVMAAPVKVRTNLIRVEPGFFGF
jgi:TonB family protein